MLLTLLAFVLGGQPNDSTAESVHNMDEVVVVSAVRNGAKRSAKGQTASIDEHLRELNHVDLVRRGSYAWEPMVNNMSSERLSTTIDGMKIFPACTDKMDPVTSYVESGNLRAISLNSGLDGNPQATGNIGGSLDLKLRRYGFDNTPFAANVNAGHEWNGHLQVYGADAAFSSHRFYTNFGAFYRHATDYKAGNGVRIPFSMFRKVNAFTNLGWRMAERHTLEASFIYDLATDVGYPALNMDVARAQGIISSLTYRRTFRNAWLSSWETKAYYNHITHLMDDTGRPDVEIHMDMPGRSQTGGLYSLLRGTKGIHDLSANFDFYYNRRFADMTMYPGGAAPMYMVTWPDAGTLNTGLSLSDDIALPHRQQIRLSAKTSWQQEQINSEVGYRALKVFFPAMTDRYQRTTGRLSATYMWHPSSWKLSAGAGWGSRAPSVTEAYGYYLNNTFDQYDYIGNPLLKNERATELNAAITFAPERANSLPLSLRWDANAFLFTHYIIGQFENRLSPMTVDAEGVKVYANLPHARIFNTSLSATWGCLRWLTWEGRLSYALGRDNRGASLPFISPIAYNTGLDFAYRQISAHVELRGNAVQTAYAPKYGETRTPAFAIVNLHLQYDFSFSHTSMTLRVGVENLLDKRYSTFSDWNKIPQKGRNIYMNVQWSL